MVSQHHRLYSSPRFYCQAKEKCYIIRTGEGGKKQVVTESQVMQKFHENQKNATGVVAGQPKSDPWQNMMDMAYGILIRGKQRTLGFIRRHRIGEKAQEMTKAEMQKIKVKVQAIDLKPIAESMKNSAVVQKAATLPTVIAESSKGATTRITHYYGVFMQSELKAQIVKISILAFEIGKGYAKKLWKFIYAAYFETKFKV